MSRRGEHGSKSHVGGAIRPNLVRQIEVRLEDENLPVEISAALDSGVGSNIRIEVEKNSLLLLVF